MSAYLVVEMWAAKEFGATCAMVMAQAIAWDDWCVRNGKNECHGYAWLKHTRKQWAVDLEGAVTTPTLLRCLSDLIASGILVVRRDPDNATYYRIDHDVLDARRTASRCRPQRYLSSDEENDPAPSDQNDPTYSGARIKKIRGSDQNDPISLSLEKEKEQTKEGSLRRGAFAPPASPSGHPTVQPILPNQDAESALEGRTPKGTVTLIEDANPTVPMANTPKASQKPPKTPSEGSLVWEAYRLAYLKRYGAEPIRNAKQNALCSQLVARLGSLAPKVATFYVTHPNGFYAQHMHALGLAVKDAEPLATQMQCGATMTQTKARQIDKDGALGDVAQRAIAKWAAIEEQERIDALRNEGMNP